MPETSAALGPLVHVLGLQRSGTNYLVELVRQNLTEWIIQTGDRTVCWKHALPDEKSGNASHTGLSAGNAVKARPELMICLIAKHPKHWLASALKPGHDLLLKRKDLVLPDGEPDIAALLTLYAAFYGNWIDVLDQRQRETDSAFLVFSYEATLKQPFEAVTRVSEKLDMDMRPQAEFITPQRVPYSKPMDDNKRAHILQGDWGLSDDYVDAVDAFMREQDALMSVLGHKAGGVSTG